MMRDRSLKEQHHWEILGKRVCLRAFKRLHSIGYFSVAFKQILFCENNMCLRFFLQYV